MSIRARLLLVFTLFALAAIGLTTGAAVVIGRRLSTAYAVSSFAQANEQLALSLRLRYDAFERTSDLSYVLPQVRQVATYKDKADWGFATPEQDASRRRGLHDDLKDAPWGWTGVKTGGFFGVTDYRQRVVYAGSHPDVSDADASSFGPVATAYNPEQNFHGAAIVTGDDPALLATGLAPDHPARCFIVFARAAAPTGVAGAAFVQGTPADQLIEDVKLTDTGTRIALAGPAGPCAGDLPDAVYTAGMGRGDGDAPLEVTGDGARWLVQRSPLMSLDGTSPIGSLVVARNLDVGLAVLDQAPTLLGIVALAVLALAVLAAWIVADWLSRPVIELESAARRVAAGNLDTTVAVRSTDELGRLAAAFNQMTEGLREREQIRGTFKKYMAGEVVDFLLAHPEAQALGGERRDLTVLFSDLAGFTTISESLEPEAVVTMLNEYFTEVSRRIVARGGTIDKYLGDAVMAFFGAPVPRADHAARACLAALDHLEALATLDARRPPELRGRLSVRVGVNTGDVVIGNIGGEFGQDYTVIGDAVNLASRLEAVNKEYGTRVLVTEATWRAAAGAVEGREIDRVRVKGKHVAVSIYEVAAAAGALSEQRAGVHVQYAAGLAHYRARRFDAAIDAFTAGLTLDPHDGPCSVLCDRSRAYASEPPPPDWDGAHTLTTK